MRNASFVLSTLTLVTAGWCQIGPQTPFPVGSDKQLFVDDFLIAHTHRVKQVVNRPQPTGEKCLTTDKPWE
jgi:hypothetical protein